jgi:hypothetical protein
MLPPIRFLAFLAGLLVLAGAQAQPFPRKPIRIVLGTGPGGFADVAARIVGQRLSKRLFYGSDWPFAAFETKMTYARAISDLADWVPDAKLRHQIGGATPLKFYFTS